jgi:hypothetical protein
VLTQPFRVFNQWNAFSTRGKRFAVFEGLVERVKRAAVDFFTSSHASMPKNSYDGEFGLSGHPSPSVALKTSRRKHQKRLLEEVNDKRR